LLLSKGAKKRGNAKQPKKADLDRLLGMLERQKRKEARKAKND
jgi:hypothetical protein